MVLFVMRRMLMFMGTMIPGMFVIMNMDIRGMLMCMRMLMEVLMSMSVSMIVGMNLIAMPVLMAVLVGVSVGMQVLVFVLALHGRYLPLFLGAIAKVNLSRGRGKAGPLNSLPVPEI